MGQKIHLFHIKKSKLKKHQNLCRLNPANHNFIHIWGRMMFCHYMCFVCWPMHFYDKSLPSASIYMGSLPSAYFSFIPVRLRTDYGMTQMEGTRSSFGERQRHLQSSTTDSRHQSHSIYDYQDEQTEGWPILGRIHRIVGAYCKERISIKDISAVGNSVL